jgi:NAD(P)H-hydrate epimerase
VLIIGGDLGASGAVMMAGMAALRVGAGAVSIATRKEHAAFLNSACPELMCHGVATSKALRSLFKKATTVIIGPGLGQARWGQQLYKAFTQCDIPAVIDADALRMLAKKPKIHARWVLTPHAGEAGALLKSTAAVVQADRPAALQQLQKLYGGVTVLKGAGTLVAGDGGIYQCDGGNSGMATAGMGDILSGVIAGLIAQGLSLAHAAALGVLLHAKAGDAVAHENGERGIMATDVLPYLQKIINNKE